MANQIEQQQTFYPSTHWLELEDEIKKCDINELEDLLENLKKNPRKRNLLRMDLVPSVQNSPAKKAKQIHGSPHHTELLNFDNVDIDAMFDEVKKTEGAQSLVILSEPKLPRPPNIKKWAYNSKEVTNEPKIIDLHIDEEAKTMGCVIKDYLKDDIIPGTERINPTLSLIPAHDYFEVIVPVLVDNYNVEKASRKASKAHKDKIARIKRRYHVFIKNAKDRHIVLQQVVKFRKLLAEKKEWTIVGKPYPLDPNQSPIEFTTNDPNILIDKITELMFSRGIYDKEISNNLKYVTKAVAKKEIIDVFKKIQDNFELIKCETNSDSKNKFGVRIRIKNPYMFNFLNVV